MNALSLHFSWAEAVNSSTAQRLGIKNVPDDTTSRNMQQAAEALEDVRTLLGNRSLHVDSWYRCPELNEAVRGSATSAHMSGWAIDFVCAGFGGPLDIVMAIQASTILFDQLIQEGTWVHISFDPRMRQQVMTAHFGDGGTTYTQGA